MLVNGNIPPMKTTREVDRRKQWLQLWYFILFLIIWKYHFLRNRKIKAKQYNKSRFDNVIIVKIILKIS